MIQLRGSFCDNDRNDIFSSFSRLLMFLSPIVMEVSKELVTSRDRLGGSFFVVPCYEILGWDDNLLPADLKMFLRITFPPFP